MKPTRRDFLIGISGAGAAAVSLHSASAFATTPAGFQPSAFLRIDASGDVYITCNRSEMGQGIRSSLPAVIAAELGADPARIIVEQAPGDDIFGDQNTDGSSSIRAQYPMLRQLGATGRVMLLAAAANRWGLPAHQLIAADHQISAPDGRIATFGELTEAAAALPIPAGAPVRPDPPPPGGTDLPFVDALAYVTGKASYGADRSLPGMVTAVIARPPDLAARVVGYDRDAALAMPGVVAVLELPNWHRPGLFSPLGGVAVVARTTWEAIQARKVLNPTWEPGPYHGVNTAERMAEMAAQVDEGGKVRRKAGKADRALDDATSTVSAVYRSAHLVHAPMEPPAAIVWYQGDRCEVWAPVQSPQRCRSRVAKTVGLNKRDVTVNVTFLGGGFGRKAKPDFVSEAAWLSKELEVPVRVQWTREDDIRHSYYHADSVQRLDAGFDAAGALTAWRHRVASPTIGSIYVSFLHSLVGPELSQGILDLPVDAPNVAVETHPVREDLRIGWLRAVYNLPHAFAVQSFVDELAAQQSKPFPDMLRQVLGPPRLLTSDETHARFNNYGSSLEVHPVDVGRWHRVIDEVRERSGYDTPASQTSAIGMAAHLSFNTYVAVAVQVSRGPRGITVEKAWVVADCGTVINRDRVLSQLEGAVVFGMTLALHGEITVRDGAVEQSNFHDYRLVRINECPQQIDLTILADGQAPGGIGEPGVPPVAPAIANAWFRLTGERLRTLPLRPATA